MGRLKVRCSLLVVVVAAMLAFTGCASPNRADDPAASAVREAHSSVSALVLALGLLLDGKATTQVTQVALEQCLEDVAAAQQELVTATDTDPDRRAQAGTAVGTAVDTLIALDNRGAGELVADDLARLRQAEQVLAAAATGLHA